SLALARFLLDRGLDVNEPAFVEEGGAFKATPLWYALSRSRNLPLATLLLKRGSSPEYCLWAAGFHDDVEVIDLLVKAGARLGPGGGRRDAFPERDQGDPLQGCGAAPAPRSQRELQDLQRDDRAPRAGEEAQRSAPPRAAPPPRCCPDPARRQGGQPARH